MSADRPLVAVAASVAAAALLATTPARGSESSLIYGIHDAAGAEALRDGGYVVESVTVSTKGDPLGYLRALVARGVTPIVRVNHGYGTAGTIPPVGPGEAIASYDDWARDVAQMVQLSPHVRHWIVGNEPNLPAEWPAGRSGTRTPLSVDRYFACFLACYDAVKRVRPEAIVMPAAVAPYAPDPGTGDGHSLEWFEKLIGKCSAAGKLDGLALHAYTHGQEPWRAASEARMSSLPMHYDLRVYRDFLARVPVALASLPTYITECDPGHWADENTGWVRAVFREVREWNDTSPWRIRCVALYRWTNADPGYGIGDLGAVRDDLALAIAEKLSWRVSAALPDLIVGSVTAGAQPLAPGVPASLACVVVNRGTAPTPPGVPIGVGFFVDGAYVGWGIVSLVLGPGASTTIRMTGGAWPATPGRHVLVARADDVNRLSESDESNNELGVVVNVPAGLPDLTVVSVSFTPARPVAGDAVVISVVLRNGGTATTPPGVAIGCGYLVDGVQVSWGVTGESLGPGQEVTLRADGGTWRAIAGTHVVTAVADDVNRMAEVRKDNNRLEVTLRVGSR